jgi:hypothetical protein
MLTSSDLDKSLQELEQSDWGESAEDDTVLVKDCLRLRRVPLRDLALADLQQLIEQNISLPYLMPLAIKQLQKNPLVEARFYPGDLLHSTLSVESSFWRENAPWRAEVRDVARRALTTLHSPEPVDGVYSEGILKSLTEAWTLFESAPHAV